MTKIAVIGHETQYFTARMKLFQYFIQSLIDQAISERWNACKNARNLPTKPYMSCLSLYLHFGEILFNQLWYAVKYLFKPWETTPELILKEAGIKLVSTYLKPIVDLKQSLESALIAFQSLKKGKS